MTDLPTFSDGEIDKHISRRVCSRCYGDLIKREADNRQWFAICLTCGDAWGGTTVSRAYAERIGQKALMERREVKENLRDLFQNPNAGKTTEQILSDLGF